MDVSTKYNLIIGLRLVIHDVFDILRYLYKLNAFFSSLLFCLIQVIMHIFRSHQFMLAQPIDRIL